MRFKDDSINPAGIRPELVLALFIADQVYAIHGTELVITSLVDGRHSHTSLHYAGCAADLRTRNLPESKRQTVAEEIKARLNRHYDVLFEGDHIHMEYQPRRAQL